MAAIFYTYSNNDVFMKNIPVAPVEVDYLLNIEGQDNMIIFTEVSITTTETNQIFLTFDDIITYFHFGKGVGSINLSGLMFCNCSGDMPGVSNFYTAISQARGQKTNVSLGNDFFTGIIQSTSASVTSEPTTMIQFTIAMSMIDNSFSR